VPPFHAHDGPFFVCKDKVGFEGLSKEVATDEEGPEAVTTLNMIVSV
jgi:hypothetical protein